MNATMLCPCPGRPHETDTVTLKDKLEYRSVVTIRKAMGLVDTDDEEVRNAQLLATCTEFYMLLGITAWTLVDEKRKPLPVSHKAIRDVLFTSSDVESVSRVAEELYNPVVLLPLVTRAFASSKPTQTPMPDEASSTSATPTDTSPQPRKPSKRSSTITFQTGAIETTSLSLVGGSSSLPKSESAA